MPANAVVLAALLALVGVPASAVIIDDFSLAQSVTQPGINSVTGPGPIGGNRDVTSSLSTFVAAGGTGTFSYTGLPEFGTVQLMYDGVGDGVLAGPGFSPVDFTAGGSANRFIFDVASLNGSASVVMNLLDLSAGLGFLIQGPLAPGLVEFEFFSNSSPFNDLTNITGVYVQVFIPDGSTVVLNSICTGTAGEGCASIAAVPEPASGFLLLAGIGVLAVLRRWNSQWQNRTAKNGTASKFV
jgi:hypothetical protein